MQTMLELLRTLLLYKQFEVYLWEGESGARDDVINHQSYVLSHRTTELSLFTVYTTNIYRFMLLPTKQRI